MTALNRCLYKVPVYWGLKGGWTSDWGAQAHPPPGYTPDELGKHPISKFSVFEKGGIKT